MNKKMMKNKVIVVLCLAGATTIYSVASVLARETGVKIARGDAAVVQSNAVVHTNSATTVHGTLPDTIAGPATTPKVGDRLRDGTIFAGGGFSAAPTDAPHPYKWKDAKRYCKHLVANGHDDWQLPTVDRLHHLYENKNAGAFTGTFNESGSFPAGHYWSSLKTFFHTAWSQRFRDGYQNYSNRDAELSVRCVREQPAAP